MKKSAHEQFVYQLCQPIREYEAKRTRQRSANHAELVEEEDLMRILEEKYHELFDDDEDPK